MISFKLVNHKFSKLTRLHIQLCSFQIALGEVRQCSTCQHMSNHDTTNDSGYKPWLELFQSPRIGAANYHVQNHCKTFDTPENKNSFFLVYFFRVVVVVILVVVLFLDKISFLLFIFDNFFLYPYICCLSIIVLSSFRSLLNAFLDWSPWKK